MQHCHLHWPPLAVTAGVRMPCSFRRRVTVACSIALAVAVSSPTIAADLRVFTPDAIIDWEPHSFAGETEYALVSIDGRDAVHAQCEPGSASGLVLRTEIDLEQTPILEWDWRVGNVFEGIDETTRGGDDYPARVYAVDARPIARWRTRAVNYVWSSLMPAGSSWPNAFAAQARMVAVRSGKEDAPDRWTTERRDLRSDFRDQHGAAPASINTLAIMTDCDNTGQAAEAWYGEIRLLPDADR